VRGGADGRAAQWVVLLFLATILSMAVGSLGGAAQPTWSFKVFTYPAKLYVGEWNEVTFNITNTDCSYREKFVYKFQWVTLEELYVMRERAAMMFLYGFITNYELRTTPPYQGYGPKGLGFYYDGELYLEGVCRGKPIKVFSASVWLPVKGMGEERAITVPIDRELRAFDAVAYIVKGVDAFSSIKFTVKLFVPSDVPPEDMGAKPAINLYVRFPEWIDYTLKNYPIAENPVTIEPYRSFNLTITNWDGAPLQGARVTIMGTKFSYVEDFETSNDGRITVRMIPEDLYQVVIRLPNGELVYKGSHWAYELAALKILRAWIFTATIEARDLHGRLLKDVRIIFDGREQEAAHGTASYREVIQGEHALQIIWRGEPLYEGKVFIGFAPESPTPITTRSVTLPIGDLLVQAVDSEGRPVGAYFRVTDLSGNIITEEIYSESGLLNITQLRMGEYVIEATNISKTYGGAASNKGVYEPGRLQHLRLPIYPVTIKVVTQDGKPLQGMVVKLGQSHAETGEDGVAAFNGVPNGTYTCSVAWADMELYEGDCIVSGATAEVIQIKIYAMTLTFLSHEGRVLKLDYVFRDPFGREHIGRNTSSLVVEKVPEGKCLLKILYRGVPLYEEEASTSDLASIRELRLPISDMEVIVKWAAGGAVWNAVVEITEVGEFGGFKMVETTGINGVAVFRDLPFTDYMITIYQPNSSQPIINERLTFSGRPAIYVVESATVTVKVVDILGNPVQGALVSIGLQEPIAQALTNSQGVATFINIIKLPSYNVKIAYGDVQSETACAPGEYLEIEIAVVTERTLWILIMAFMLLLAMVAVAVFTIRRARRRTVEKEFY